MNVAIIAAAGRGTRMAGKRPKQFQELAGTPIILHTLKAFERCNAIHEIIVVLAEEEIKGFLSLAKEHGLRKIAAVISGGNTRAESVLRGLQAVDAVAVEIIAVHDGVRPFIAPEDIARTVEAAKLQGAAILVSRPVDTIKEIEAGAIVRTLDRSKIRNALTPQCFQYELLLRAYSRVDVSDPGLTDESSLVERLGVRIAIVEGSPRNIKITNGEDLAIGEAILREMNFEL
ncbi:MAG: 2-C-methyl-D-erythritol 4-phosphate cytidylyltransferase [Acidobacteriota bacterium]